MNGREWQAYYGECGSYLTSLHAQLLAVMSLQGAVAIGGLATMDFERGALGIGAAGALLELMLLTFAWKLFVQCGEVCKMMSIIELEKIKLPADLALKSVLMKKPLFTSKWMRVLILGAGALFAILLAVAGFAIHGGH